MKFEDFVAAASYAAGTETVYATLSDSERAKINEATARLDAGKGVPYSDVKARIAAKLKSSDA